MYYKHPSVMIACIRFAPYLLHRAPRHPPRGESDAQLVHIDPSVLVQIQLREEFSPELLAFGIDPAVLAPRPPHHALHARSATERHRAEDASKKGAAMAKQTTSRRVRARAPQTASNSCFAREPGSLRNHESCTSQIAIHILIRKHCDILRRDENTRLSLCVKTRVRKPRTVVTCCCRNSATQQRLQITPSGGLPSANIYDILCI